MLKRNDERKSDVLQLKRKKSILQQSRKGILVMWLLSYEILTILNIIGNIEKTLFAPLVVAITIFYVILFIISINIEDILDKKIKILKSYRIKELAEEGNLKDFVVLKNRAIKDMIFKNSIEKIIIKEENEKNFEVEVLLKNGTLVLPIYLPKEEVIFLINKSETLKNEIIEKAISTITIEEIEGKEKINISSKNINVSVELDEQDLSRYLKLKKDDM